MAAQGRNTTDQGRPASSPLRETSEYPRLTNSSRRTNGRACVACHERKVKCDILEKGVPCSNCVSSIKANCRLYEKKKTRTSLARLARNFNTPLQPRGRGNQPATAPATSIAARHWPDCPASPTAERSQPRRRYSPQAARDLGSVGSEDEQATRNLVDFIDREELRSGEISQTSRLYFIGTEFSNLNYLVRQRSQRPDQNIYHFGSHQLARKVPSIPQEALRLPERALADQLVRAYFVHINRGFPIVDEDLFMKRYTGADSQKPVSMHLLHSILLVGAHVLAPQRRDAQSLKSELFHRAKTLFDSRFDQDRESYVQTALLLSWQCDDLEDVVSNSWHWIGVAVRIAFGMGMHRDASHSNLNPIDKCQWVRLWWTLFQFDVMVSASSGRPQAMNIEESDVPALQESHFEGVPDHESTFATQHTRLCIIFSRAMKKRVSLQSSLADKIEATRQADEALAQFMTHLPERLRLPVPTPDTWQATLHLTYNNFLLLLHRPPPRPGSQESLMVNASDLDICGDAVVVVSSIFESLRARDLLCKLWLPAMHVLFTATVHVASQLGSASPLVSAKSLRMFDSFLLTLSHLCRQWMYAQSLLRLFEDRDMWNGRGRPRPQAAEAPRQPNGLQGGLSDFSLRPNPLGIPGHIATDGSGGALSSAFPATSPAPGYEQSRGPFFPGHASPVLHLNGNIGGHPGTPGLVNDGPPYNGGFAGQGGLGMARESDNLDMLPVPSALEFLLAGMGNEFDFLN